MRLRDEGGALTVLMSADWKDTGYLEIRETDGSSAFRCNGDLLSLFDGSAFETIQLDRIAGTVAVGTSDPEARLHVRDGAAGNVTANPNSVAVFEADSGMFVCLLAPDGASKGVLFGNASDPNSGSILYDQAAVGAETMQFRAGGNSTKMVLFPNGDVGLGTGSALPGARLEVESSLAIPLKVDRHGNDGVLVTWARQGASVGSVTVSGGNVSYNAFTGSHYAWSEAEPEVGALMTLTGDNGSLAGEVVYGVAPCGEPNDPACLGAYGSTVTIGEDEAATTVRLVAAVGNGELWVVDTGADVAPGDLLISSSVAGCAMRDDPARFPVGHVVARAAEAVDWSRVEPDGDGVRRARISVLFDPFTRGRDDDARIEELQERIAGLEALVARIAAETTRR